MNKNKLSLILHGLNLYDYGARLYDPLVGQFTSIDPLCEKYYSVSPYAFCVGNPVNRIDPDGRDTIRINYINDKWAIDDPIISKGNDVFQITSGNNTSTYTFSEGKYGERVCALNLEIGDTKSSYTLGVYHISGASKDGTGYYVVPGGKSNTRINSGARIPDGEYPILSPNGGKWRQPQVGGEVLDRGIRFHYGFTNPRDWTEGCFVLSFDYEYRNGSIYFSKQFVLYLDWVLFFGKVYRIWGRMLWKNMLMYLVKPKKVLRLWNWLL